MYSSKSSDVVKFHSRDEKPDPKPGSRLRLLLPWLSLTTSLLPPGSCSAPGGTCTGRSSGTGAPCTPPCGPATEESVYGKLAAGATFTRPAKPCGTPCPSVRVIGRVVMSL
jgi:hypothetical protein